MAKQTFTAGQVLTAAQQNSLQGNDYNQTVSTKTASYTLVAADAGTRIVMNAAGATTITVNTSLFSAGDTLVLQNIGAGTCTVTAGTATVSSAGPLAIPQYGSGTLYFTSTGVSIYFPSAVTVSAGGLTLITKTTISAVSTTNVNNCFTSTYKNYYLTSNLTTSATAPLNMRLRVGGADDTTANYSTGYYFLRLYGAVAGNATVANQTSFQLVISGNDRSYYMNMVVYGPQTSTDTLLSYNSVAADTVVTDYYSFTGGGQFVSTTSFDGFSIFTGTAATISGTINIYGLADS